MFEGDTVFSKVGIHCRNITSGFEACFSTRFVHHFILGFQAFLSFSLIASKMLRMSIIILDYESSENYEKTFRWIS